MPRDLDSLISDNITLPTIPATAAAVVDLLNQEEVEVQAVADVITRDPALAAKLLRFVNSPIYAQRRPVDTIQRAVVVIGSRSSLNIALSFSLVSQFSAAINGGLDCDRYWRRSLLAAASARLIARQLRGVGEEEVLLAALLQDLGMLVLDQTAPEIYSSVAGEAQSGPHLRECERAAVGFGHDEVGAYLFKHWRFSDQAVRAVASSHRLSGERLDYFSACVAVAGELADLLLADGGRARLRQLELIPVRQWGWSAGKLAEVIEASREAASELARLFDLPVYSAEDLEAISRRAEEALELREDAAVASLANDDGGEIDALTGVFSRDAFLNRLQAMLVEGNRLQRPLSLAFISIGNFLEVRRLLGGKAGDRLMKASAAVIQRTVRSADMVARYGDALFVVALPGFRAAQARDIGDRVVRACSEELQVVSGAEAISLTYSVCVVTHGDGVAFDSAEELARAGGEAAYLAKFNSDGVTKIWDGSRESQP